MSKHAYPEIPHDNQIVLVRFGAINSDQPEFAVCKFSGGHFYKYDEEHGWVTDFQCENVIKWQDIEL